MNVQSALPVTRFEGKKIHTRNVIGNGPGLLNPPETNPNPNPTRELRRTRAKSYRKCKGKAYNYCLCIDYFILWILFNSMNLLAKIKASIDE